MKRVLHVWQSEYPWEVRVGKINRALINSGYEVEVLARNRGDEPESETVEGVRIQRVSFSGPRAFTAPVPGNPIWKNAIRRAAEEFRPDLILVRDIPLALAAAAVARKRGIPIVLDMAEHYPEAMRSWKKYSDNVLGRLFVHHLRVPDRVEARAVTRMDGILVVCEEQKERLTKQYGIPADRITLVLNTPELEAWAPFEKGSSSQKPRRFGYHGILCEDRELETVLKGFDVAARSDPELTLLIAGGGESEESLRALAGTLASRSRIRFTGRYRPEDLGKLYSEVDFGIVSLRANPFTENTLANKFFDYPALGKPFIFTNLAPLRRVMARMSCGLSFSPGSVDSATAAFLGILRKDYAGMSRNGLEAIQREYNWGVDSARLLAFISNFDRKSTRDA